MQHKPGDIVENTRLKVTDDTLTKHVVGFIHGCTAANISAAEVHKLLWAHYDVIIFVAEIEEEQQAVLQFPQRDGLLAESHIAGFIEAWALCDASDASDASVRRVVQLLYGKRIPIEVIHQMRQDFLDTPKPLHGC